MNLPPFSLGRLVFLRSDVREFVGIVKRLYRGLDTLNTQNPDLLKERFAKLALYSGMHELFACLGRGPVPAAGSITRADIQLIFAYQLHLDADIPLVDAWLRAGRARLRGLSFDRYTVERQKEDRLKGQGEIADQQCEVEPGLPDVNWHEEQARFFTLGAPAYDLCVREDGRAFNWACFTAMYDAIRGSRLARKIVDPEERYPAGSEEAIDNFLSKTLIPQSWVPLSQHIQNGLAVSDHEVVWLFVESGLCIGRGIRHKTHGGLLPRLYLTEEEVAEGLSFVVRGAYIHGGSSLLDPLFQPAKGDDAVYTLKPGVRNPGAVFDPRKEVKVPTDDLELIPHLYAGYRTMVQPYLGTKQDIWAIDGKAVKVRADGSLTNTYYETKPWLSESDMPSIFPDFRPGPAVNDRDRFAFAHDVPNKVLLPPKALDFQDRATSVLARKEQSAHELLHKLAENGELLMICKNELLPYRHAGIANILIAEMLPEVSSEQIQRIDSVSDHILKRYPDLGVFPPLALLGAICVHCKGMTFDDVNLDTLTRSDVLVGLVMLGAGFQGAGPFRFFKPGPAKIAVVQWWANEIELDGIHDAAAALEGYSDALVAQQSRITLIKAALDRDADRRRAATNHGYVYVGSELPRAKPRGLMQNLGTLEG
ncbi:hypothetical protein [Pseudomonas asiatica]|uniref:hypothetical protein n=1 Tax=Pseudomonas asiatica TaxID=2219225 RepID=UPI0010C01661|nr:hypothetical protein [Pseudomonas asiatica]